MGRAEEVAMTAYDLWQQAGCPEGCALDHWVQAEAIWAQGQPPANGAHQADPPTRPASQ
jgi:hypothetical protein